MSNNNIPSAVRKQGEESERLAEEHGLKKGQGKDIPPADDPGKKKPDEPAEKPKPSTNEEDWKTRFKNYKQTTDGTISELRQQLSALHDDIAGYKTQSAQLNEQLNAKPSQASKNVDTGQGFDIESLPADMREKYDDDFLESMSKLNTLQMTAKIGDLQERLDRMEGKVNNVETTQVKSARDLFYEALDKNESSWETIGASKEFAEFLMQPESEFSSRSLKEVLDEANANNNANTVLKIIAKYKQNAATADNGGVNTDDTKNKLNEMVSPEGGNAANGDIADDIGVHTESFTQSQVEKFYVDVTRSAYSPEEAAAIEKKIMAAQQAGKILPG